MTYIFDCQLFPCIDYFKNLIPCTHINIEAYDNFQKMTFRNRYMIAAANGLSGLTIPVVGGREQKTLMTEILIDRSTKWEAKHWRSLTSAYRKAPFFEFYCSEIQKLLFSKEEALFIFNINILDALLKMLNINLVIGFTSRFEKKNDTFLDFRNFVLPKNFQEAGNVWRPRYAQVFEDRLGFQPNLSIIDLLFNEGPNAANLLKQSVK